MKSVSRFSLRRLRRPLFLTVRDPFNPHFFDVIPEWVREHCPQLLPLFEFNELPFRIPRLSNFVLHLPWLQDPVQQQSEELYRHAVLLAEQCDACAIPIVNRVERLLNATKSAGAKLMAGAGVRTPQIAIIRNLEEFRETRLGIPLPLFVREDWGHGGEMLRADTREAVRTLPLERFARPIAVELIETADPHDGLYRKYRYLAAGRHGVSHHLQTSEDWIARGSNRIVTDVTRQEELSYIAKQDPNHELLQRSRHALGLDLVAFDYSYDRTGRIVVWEANPFPWIRFSTKRLVYRNAAIDRTLCAILKMYLEYAALPVPGRLEGDY